MILNNRGQAVAMDIILVCICVSIFAVGIWGFSMGGQAPESEALRSRQDYARSMLLTALYTTPDLGDKRYESKSISDLLVMYLVNRDQMSMDIVIAKMKEAKIGEALKEKAIGTDAEWFLYADTDPHADPGSSSPDARLICLHGKSGSDVVEQCPPGTKIYAKESTAAAAWIAVPGSGTGNSDGSGPMFFQIPIFLAIKWA
jgi:hypothetical protein